MNNQLNINKMRRVVFTLLMFLTLSLSAQNNDGIIKFKGVPVDGTKNEMISKLKQKGFTYDYTNDMFKGEFDGNNIIGFIQTYNDKVYDIRFTYDVSGYQKAVVIHRFNSLVGRFETNEKYFSYINLDKVINNIDTYEIDTYEEIGYEMKKGKIYRAQYFYKFDKDPSDTTGYYQFKKETYDKFSSLAFSKSNADAEDINRILQEVTSPEMYYMHRLEQDLVQFYIIDGIEYGTYNIMFDYYNRRNAPNGDDL